MGLHSRRCRSCVGCDERAHREGKYSWPSNLLRDTRHATRDTPADGPAVERSGTCGQHRTRSAYDKNTHPSPHDHTLSPPPVTAPRVNQGEPTRPACEESVRAWVAPCVNVVTHDRNADRGRNDPAPLSARATRELTSQAAIGSSLTGSVPGASQPVIR